MSRGYYSIKLIVHHSHDEKKEFLNKNSDYIHISKKILENLLKSYSDKNILCESCKAFHLFGRINGGQNERENTGNNGKNM